VLVVADNAACPKIPDAILDNSFSYNIYSDYLL
jgi:hypothetical protein